MPPPLNLPPDEFEARVKEQARIRQANRRARLKEGHVTRHGTPRPSLAGGHVTPPRTPPVEVINLETEKIRRLLEPFASRGYDHDPQFWVEMAATYPAVALVVEAYNIASWLKKPLKKNRAAGCSTGFIINWLKKAQRDAAAAPARALPGVVGNGTYHGPPDAFLPEVPDRNPARLESDLERIDPRVAARALSEAKRLTLPEKLELAKNGRHR